MQKQKIFLRKSYFLTPSLVFLSALLFLVPDHAYAAGGPAAWEKALQTIVDYMTGNTGRLLATIAVAALGYGAYTGRISWSRAITVAIGIGIVFGAATIVDLFAGK